MIANLQRDTAIPMTWYFPKRHPHLYDTIAHKLVIVLTMLLHDAHSIRINILFKRLYIGPNYSKKNIRKPNPAPRSNDMMQHTDNATN